MVARRGGQQTSCGDSRCRKSPLPGTMGCCLAVSPCAGETPVLPGISLPHVCILRVAPERRSPNRQVLKSAWKRADSEIGAPPGPSWRGYSPDVHVWSGRIFSSRVGRGVLTAPRAAERVRPHRGALRTARPTNLCFAAKPQLTHDGQMRPTVPGAA